MAKVTVIIEDGINVATRKYDAKNVQIDTTEHYAEDEYTSLHIGTTTTIHIYEGDRE